MNKGVGCVLLFVLILFMAVIGGNYIYNVVAGNSRSSTSDMNGAEKGYIANEGFAEVEADAGGAEAAEKNGAGEVAEYVELEVNAAETEGERVESAEDRGGNDADILEQTDEIVSGEVPEKEDNADVAAEMNAMTDSKSKLKGLNRTLIDEILRKNEKAAIRLAYSSRKSPHSPSEDSGDVRKAVVPQPEEDIVDVDLFCRDSSEIIHLGDTDKRINLTLRRILYIKDITGISKIHNVVGLNISENINPKLSNYRLKWMKDQGVFNGLTRLGFSSCSTITDFTPLAGLSGLKDLDLAGCNRITDISFISDMKGLVRLNLAGCSNITDYTPIPDHIIQTRTVHIRHHP